MYIAPRFLICEDKDADERCGNRAYDQPHCFCYFDPSSPSSLYPSSEAALARLCIAKYRISHDGAHCCIRTIVVYRVFDRLQHELRTVDPCSLEAMNQFFTFDAICNFRIGGFKKYRIEYSSVFNSFQVVSLLLRK